MDSVLISSLSALLGSVVGASASIATAWLTQRTQSRRERILAEIEKRERLYAEFLAECSKLGIYALDHTLENTDTLVKAYELLNRITLASSPPVIEAAARAIRRILEYYFGPNLTRDELREIALTMKDDMLKVFSETRREELTALQRG